MWYIGAQVPHVGLHWLCVTVQFLRMFRDKVEVSRRFSVDNITLT